jgi:alkyldihydroxyacetonephosphate synthase
MSQTGPAAVASGAPAEADRVLHEGRGRLGDLLGQLRAHGPGVGADLLDAGETDLGRDLWPYRLKFGGEPTGGALVCRPDTTEATSRILSFAAQAGLCVLPVGGGSNVVGALDGGGDLLLSTERLIGEPRLDPLSQIVTVGAGTRASDLEDMLNQRGFTTGIQPQSLRISTIGGWVSTRATGTCSARYGGVERAVVGLRAVGADGEGILIDPRVRPPGGLDLISLLLGTEGSLAVVTEVSLLVHRLQDERRLAVLFDTFAAGLQAQRELVQQEIPVGVVRLYNVAESDALLPGHLAGTGQALLSVTVMGTQDLLRTSVEAARTVMAKAGGHPLPDDAADGWFDHRFDAESLMQDRNAEPLSFFDTIEVSVPWSAAETCADELETRLSSLCTTFHMHSSHVYVTGTCLYMILYVDAATRAELQEKWSMCWGTALDVVERHQGSVGHHHGVGALRAGYYARTPDGRHHVLVKSALDTKGTLAARALDQGGPLTPLTRN